MKKLLLIPILVLAMGFSVAPLSITPEANARDYRHHRGHGHYKHRKHRRYHRNQRHHNYRPYRHRRYKHYSHYRPYKRYRYYKPYRHHRYRRHSDTNFFLGLSFPGLLFGASHFDTPHHHGPWCYR